ncbi:Rho-binding antiterminator [Oceanisphaera litoralis]|uniref:Rho-binding antiterminator n=1 Tax=Oceanisphaera litoralis TaxID=225144 RepID=UPI0019567BC8|nr:Rho-binding antiterminator [Oceanisphaera litoralis]MBM7456743.1 Rho-binding antiterminator [Oceanisphaera litoralis]
MMSCEQHDYIEIACLYRYPVILTLTSGAELVGIALDTARNELRQECIRIRDHDAEHLVPLATISRMTANIDNPHFRVISFD